MPSTNTITGSQITARASYHEASEMQKRGQVNNTACNRCAQGNGRWTQCVSVAGELRGACANCHWQSLSNSCSLTVKQIRPQRERKTKILTDPTASPTTESTTESNADSNAESNAESNIEATIESTDQPTFRPTTRSMTRKSTSQEAVGVRSVWENGDEKM
jgi:Tfp pilus assembly protein PilX